MHWVAEVWATPYETPPLQNEKIYVDEQIAKPTIVYEDDEKIIIQGFKYSDEQQQK